MERQIISYENSRPGKKCLVFTFTDGEVVYGPFVEHRPEDEDVDVFLDSYEQALTTGPV